MKQQKISILMAALLVSVGVMAEDPSLKNPLMATGQVQLAELTPLSW
jgi:hypothetical protein